MGSRATHADALHHAGRLEANRTRFAKAETIQAAWQPTYPLLYSVKGNQYCDLLLGAAERAVWRRWVGFRPAGSPGVAQGASGAKLRSETDAETATLLSDLTAIERRAEKMFEGRTPADSVLGIALDHLTLGRVHLLRAVLESPSTHLPLARTHLDTALATLRQAGQNQFLPPALLPCAWLHVLLGEWDTARQRLDEAYALCTRGGNPQKGWQGGMRLHLADTLLHRARLFGWRDEYPWPGRTPKADLDEAGILIDACGYHRRDQDLADARAVLG